MEDETCLASVGKSGFQKPDHIGNLRQLPISPRLRGAKLEKREIDIKFPVAILG